MTANFYILFAVVLFGSSTLILGWRPFRIYNSNITAYSFSDKVGINASIIDLEGISLFIDVKKPLQRPIVRLEIYVDSGNGLFDLKYINETVDLCRFFRVKKYMPFLRLIYRTIVEQGNYPTSCPIKKMLYMGENMKLDVEKLPPTLPNKNISLGAIVSSKEGSIMKPLFKYSVIAQIVNV